jgi:hypothetical protein
MPSKALDNGAVGVTPSDAIQPQPAGKVLGL